jgi:hypothetical protein
VRRRLGDSAAVVEDAHGARAVYQSSLPLSSRSDAGALEPTNLELIRKGTAIVPRNPIVPMTIGGTLGAGTGFDGTGIEFRVDGDPTAEASLTDNKAFFANTQRDTDVVVAPQPSGVETFFELRSVDSPDEQRLHFTLPAGAALRTGPGGGVEIARGDTRLAAIAPPRAWDADGVAVKSSYVVSGNDLIVRVEHRGGDYAYPIAVDPQIVYYWDYRNWNTNPSLGDNGWRFLTPYPSQFESLHLYPTWYGRGDYIKTPRAWTHYNGGEWGAWDLWAPAGAYIFRVDFNNGHYDPSGRICIQEGLLGADGGPVRDGTFGYWDTHDGRWHATGTEASVCSTVWDQWTWSFYFSSDNGASVNFNPPAAVEGNIASWGLAAFQASDAYESIGFEGGALVGLGDRVKPSATIAGVTPGAWVDQATVQITGRDTGLGVNTVSASSDTSDPVAMQGACGAPALGATPCPATVGPVQLRTSEMPEGARTISATTLDAVNNAGSNSWTVKVDRTPPSGPALSGSLWDHRNQAADHRNEGLYDPVYTLNASAGDSRSGLKSIDVQVDNGAPYHYAAACSGTDGCSNSIPPWTFNSDAYTDGDHTVTVTAKDQLADQVGVDNSRHVSTTSFQVTVDRRGDIYHGVGWEGDPATNYTTGEEYAQINTQNMRHQTENSLVTRNVVMCMYDVQGCAQERSQTQASRTTPGASDDYTVTTGTSHNDARMTGDSELLAPANSDLGTPTSIGPINDALQLWQRPPPAHGSTYSLYTSTQATVTDEQPADEVTKLWLDSVTKMPLRSQTTLGGAVESDLYYVYDRGRLTSADVAADFFAASAPGNVGQMDTIDLPLVDMPEPVDPPPATDEQQIADAQALRTDLGLRNDYDYVKSLFDDSTLDNGTDAYGIPLTAGERADLDARVAAEQDLAVVDEYGANQAAGSFAGAYIDQRNGGAIYVGFTSNVATNMNAVKAIYPHPELLHPFPTTPQRTLQQLDALQAQVETDWDNGALSTLGINSVGQDAEANQVVVTSPAPTPADDAVLAARYGPGVALEQRDMAPADTASNHRTPPNIGGLKIRSTQKAFGQTFTPRCTSGFGAVKHYNTNGHKGNEYFDVSAGHCIVSTDEPNSSKHGYGIRWHHNGKPLFGITITNTLVPAGSTTGSDAMSIQVQPGTQSNRIYVRTGKDAKPHLLRITGSLSHFHKHQLVCHSGYATRREVCGEVRRTGVKDRFQGNGTKVVHQIEVKMSSCGVHDGDSGGPVFHNHKAFGILRISGRLGTKCTAPDGNLFTFTKIGFAVADLGGLELLR